METVEILSEYERERHKPEPDFLHTVVQTNLMLALHSLYEDCYTILPELDIQMPEPPIAVPDLCIYPLMKIDFSHDVAIMTELPLTAIEVATAAQTDYDRVRRVYRYLNAGVKSCWLVLPVYKAVHVYSAIGVYRFFTAAETLSDTATNIELPLAEIFV